METREVKEAVNLLDKNGDGCGPISARSSRQLNCHAGSVPYHAGTIFRE